MRTLATIATLFVLAIFVMAPAVPAMAQGSATCTAVFSVDGSWSFTGCTRAEANAWLADDSEVEQTSEVVQPTVVSETTATATPEATRAPATNSGTGSDEWQFSIEGVRTSVPMTEVDYARGGFSSPYSFLSLVLAEPGKLMVGPDFPQDIIDDSRGAIGRVNPGNQYRLTNNDYQDVGCAEGSFIFVSVQEATVETTNFTMSFRAPDGDGTHLYVRCANSDSERGSDAGNNLRFSGYRPNYGLVQHFSGQPAGGFVSADGAAQALEIGVSGTSSGSEGANNVWVIGVDSNTGAYTVARWDGEEMTLVETNWWRES